VTVLPTTVTLPFSQATLYSLPEIVVPNDTEKVPEMPDFVRQIASTVSTGGRYGWRRVV
jgi:hypothetical protein